MVRFLGLIDLVALSLSLLSSLLVSFASSFFHISSQVFDSVLLEVLGLVRLGVVVVSFKALD